MTERTSRTLRFEDKKKPATPPKKRTPPPLTTAFRLTVLSHPERYSSTPAGRAIQEVVHNQGTVTKKTGT